MIYRTCHLLCWAAAAVTVLWVWRTDATAAADRFSAPYDLAWGMALDAVPHDAEIENNGVLSGAILDLGVNMREIHNVIGVFCAGAGLQQVRIVSSRFDTFDLPRAYRRRVREMTETYGAPDRVEPEQRAVYWADRVAVESHRGSKTKFYLLVLHNGPDYAACAARQAALTH